MESDFLRNWMWSEACDMLIRAERLHRSFFRAPDIRSRIARWEPPVDILETESEVLVLVALPGVNIERVAIAVDARDLIITGVRLFPADLGRAIIHRLELPQGAFERRVALPEGRYSAIDRRAVDGCLLITLEKSGDRS